MLLLWEKVRSIRPSPLSLMPEGLDTGMKPQDLADLMAYVRSIGPKEVAKAVGMNPIFPAEFLAALNVGEESGQIPEQMGRQAEFYREETARRAKILTKAMAWGVYCLVGIFITTISDSVVIGSNSSFEHALSQQVGGHYLPPRSRACWRALLVRYSRSMDSASQEVTASK